MTESLKESPERARAKHNESNDSENSDSDDSCDEQEEGDDSVDDDASAVDEEQEWPGDSLVH